MSLLAWPFPSPHLGGGNSLNGARAREKSREGLNQEEEGKNSHEEG